MENLRYQIKGKRILFAETDRKNIFLIVLASHICIRFSGKGMMEGT